MFNLLHPRLPPPLRLLLSLPNPHLLQQHIPPIITRRIRAPHLATMSQEPRQSLNTGSRIVDLAVVAGDRVVHAGETTHFGAESGFAPFLVCTGDSVGGGLDEGG